jgi:protein-S-isoprenylcysteine O-methyltransferase Ste14
MLGQHFAHHRIAWSRGAVVLLIAVVLFTRPGQLLATPIWLNQTSELLGYVLLVVATLWRIWCSLFIAGIKNGELAGEGPYSMVRNPLYLGNFLGLVGVGFAVQQPLLAVVIGGLFALSYPFVIAQEEANLTRIFGERYREYCARVPRWLPDWSLYREPSQLTLAPRYVRKAIFDAMWFLWAFGLWELVQALHSFQLLPTLL